MPTALVALDRYDGTGALGIIRPLFTRLVSRLFIGGRQFEVHFIGHWGAVLENLYDLANQAGAPVDGLRRFEQAIRSLITMDGVGGLNQHAGGMSLTWSKLDHWNCLCLGVLVAVFVFVIWPRAPQKLPADPVHVQVAYMSGKSPDGTSSPENWMVILLVTNKSDKPVANTRFGPRVLR